MTTSMPIARARLISAGVAGGLDARRLRKMIRRANRSTVLSTRWAKRATWRPMSETRPDALRRDRGADLGSLGDPLDELLRLIAGQQPAPDLVDQLAVERLDQGLLHRLALQGSLDRLLDGGALQDPAQRPLDRLALQRGDDRLLGGDLDRAVDAGGPGDALGPAHAGAEQAGGEGKRPPAGRRAARGGAVGSGPSAIAPRV